MAHDVDSYVLHDCDGATHGSDSGDLEAEDRLFALFYEPEERAGQWSRMSVI